MRELRTDQTETLDAIRSGYAEGHRAICVQAPTGYGKTVLSAKLVENAREKKKRLIYSVPAISLVDQTVEMFYSQGLYDVGVIQAHHHMTDWSQPVQICSVQSLQKRTMPDFDIMMIDECHIWFRWYEKIFRDPAYQKKLFIGQSATPWTKGLGNYYTHLVVAATTQDLINRGLLSDFRVYAPSHPDLTGVPTIAGDYHEGKLSEKMQEGTLTADVVETWLKLAEWRPTLCYAVDVLHARKLQAQFRAAGVPCGYQDAKTKDAERRQLKKDFHSGGVKVVVSVSTMTMGIDWDVRCISLVRPTKSEMLFDQIMGRGLRTAPGKDDLLCLDHSDNHLRLGFVTDIDAAHTSLHQGKTPLTATASKIRLPKECPGCGYLKAPGNAKCPVCAFVAVAHSKIEPTAGELAELKRKAKEKPQPLPAMFFAELRCYGRDRGYKPMWAAMKFKEKFGRDPDWGVAPALTVTKETLSWIKSRNIAWAKSKARRFINASQGI